jgi:hypothetical protein
MQHLPHKLLYTSTFWQFEKQATQFVQWQKNNKMHKDERKKQ